MSSTQTRAKIYGPILSAEAEVLRDDAILLRDPKKQEILRTIGASVGSRAVALVAVEDGYKPKPDHFVSLDLYDMGAELLPNGTLFKAFELPTPEEAYITLRGNATDPEKFDQELLERLHLTER